MSQEATNGDPRSLDSESAQVGCSASEAEETTVEVSASEFEALVDRVSELEDELEPLDRETVGTRLTAAIRRLRRTPDYDVLLRQHRQRERERFLVVCEEEPEWLEEFGEVEERSEGSWRFDSDAERAAGRDVRVPCAGEGCDARVTYAGGYLLPVEASEQVRAEGLAQDLSDGVVCGACQEEMGGCRHAVTAGERCFGCESDRRVF